MPVKAGIPTLRALRQDERFRRLPVVVLTGRNDPRLVKATLGSGPTDYILKDAAAEKIGGRLARHLGTPPESAANSPGQDGAS
jgi:CheY-like chemotaxis protein